VEQIRQLLIEALRSGYAVPAFVALFALLTRRVWVELAQTFRDWVRSATARRRADLVKELVSHALNARSKDQRNHCVEMLRLLLNARDHSSPEPTPIDPPPDEPPEEPP
jgi:hypothetical protein